MNSSVEIESFLAVATGLIAWSLENVGSLHVWFGRYTSKQKQMIMAIVPLILTAAAFAIVCRYPSALSGVSCPEGGAEAVFRFVWSWLLAFITGQGVHYGTKRKGK